MISKTPGYKTSDAQWFADLDDAQAHELCVLLQPQTKECADTYEDVLTRLVARKNEAMAILGMKQRGRPRTVVMPKKPRKIKGFESSCDCAAEEEKPHVKACKV